MLGLGPVEIVVVGAIAVMLYGKRLPEVGRSFGRTMGDLRRQWQQFSREIDMAASADVGPPRLGRGGRWQEDEPPGSRVVESPRFEPPSD